MAADLAASLIFHNPNVVPALYEFQHLNVSLVSYRIHYLNVVLDLHKLLRLRVLLAFYRLHHPYALLAFGWLHHRNVPLAFFRFHRSNESFSLLSDRVKLLLAGFPIIFCRSTKISLHRSLVSAASLCLSAVALFFVYYFSTNLCRTSRNQKGGCLNCRLGKA